MASSLRGSAQRTVKAGSTVLRSSGVEYRILGPLEAVEAGRPVPLGGAKQRALLAVLLLEANRPVSGDRLVEALWGESPSATPHHAVQVYVSQLRKALGGAAIVTRTPGYLVAVEP